MFVIIPAAKKAKRNHCTGGFISDFVNLEPTNASGNIHKALTSFTVTPIAITAQP